jgi:hypothetical protein
MGERRFRDSQERPGRERKFRASVRHGGSSVPSSIATGKPLSQTGRLHRRVVATRAGGKGAVRAMLGIYALRLQVFRWPPGMDCLRRSPLVGGVGCSFGSGRESACCSSEGADGASEGCASGAQRCRGCCGRRTAGR